jgi:DNA-binding Xre family transcriptional regulator
MLTLHLTPIFKARGIKKPYSFLVKAGLSPHSANYIAYGKGRVFRLDHIELLCKLLVCEPNDLLAWKPNKNELIAKDHPLTKLKQEPIDDSWQQTLNKMSYKQLKEVKIILPDEKNDL